MPAFIPAFAPDKAEVGTVKSIFQQELTRFFRSFEVFFVIEGQAGNKQSVWQNCVVISQDVLEPLPVGKAVFFVLNYQGACRYFQLALDVTGSGELLEVIGHT